MNKFTIGIFASFLFAASLMSGCASVPMANEANDTAAKAFRVPNGKSNIYVYRNESMGAAIKMKVNHNGKHAGTTAAKTYFVLTVKPGKHTLISHAENESDLIVNARAGKNHFVWQEVKMGIMSARTKLQMVDEKTGKAGVSECKMIDTSAL